jgi:hypothetical protein
MVLSEMEGAFVWQAWAPGWLWWRAWLLGRWCFAWQVWHLMTSTSLLCGRCGTCCRRSVSMTVCMVCPVTFAHGAKTCLCRLCPQPSSMVLARPVLAQLFRIQNSCHIQLLVLHTQLFHTQLFHIRDPHTPRFHNTTFLHLSQATLTYNSSQTVLFTSHLSHLALSLHIPCSFTHTHTHLCHPQRFHRQLLHMHLFPRQLFHMHLFHTPNLSHATLPPTAPHQILHIQVLHQQLFHAHTTTNNSFTYNSSKQSILHHLLCVSCLSRPASTACLQVLEEIDMLGFPVL